MLLEVNEISVFYDVAQVLWDVSFEVNEGEIIAIVGSNGAGKTTTLKTIIGLLRPASGSIKFLDQRIDNLPTMRLAEMGLVLVPEGRGLFPYMTVLKNLLLGAYNRRAWNQRKKTLGQVFHLFPVLEERRDQLAGTLSGGEQQMLAIARALMSMPRLLMLDEPSLGLAPKLVLKIFEIIKEFNKLGITVLVVEQNIYQVLTIANRGYIMETGRITLEGSGQDLLDNETVKKAYLGV